MAMSRSDTRENPEPRSTSPEKTEGEPSPHPTGSKPLPGGLYLVATPIGNLGDITHRAQEILNGADLILCEDTRVSGKLLTRFSIATKRIAYHEHNAERLRPEILDRLERGEALALISDAGTPLINDPGYKLVRDCVAAGHFVTAAPGANAPITALILSGLPSDRFYYHGFPPPKRGARQKELAGLAGVPGSLIFLESPKRLPESLADMRDALGGERPAAVARELTKLHEEVRRDSLTGLAAHYGEAGPPKGEVVVVVGPGTDPSTDLSEAQIDARLRALIPERGVKGAAADLADLTGRPKRDLYARAVTLKAESGDEPG